MPEIKVYFADGSIEKFHLGQTFKAIRINESDWDNGVLKENQVIDFGSYGVLENSNQDLKPSFLALLSNSVFFYDVEKPNIIYSSSSVVKIESV